VLIVVTVDSDVSTVLYTSISQDLALREYDLATLDVTLIMVSGSCNAVVSVARLYG